MISDAVIKHLLHTHNKNMHVLKIEIPSFKKRVNTTSFILQVLFICFYDLYAARKLYCEESGDNPN
jgi:hypothetical protein